MDRIQLKQVRRIRRKRGIRRRVLGVPDRPRLTVFRSAKHIYGQVIDDLSGRTLASASTTEKAGKSDKDSKGGGNCAAAAAVGKTLAGRAKDAGIEQVVFDRNGYRYHGRVKALADALREGGVKF